MIIYIVTSGEYSDYGIEAVYTDQEAAEKHVKLGNLSREDSYRLETYETDAVVPQLYYTVTYYRAISREAKATGYRVGEPILVEQPAPQLAYEKPRTHVRRDGNIYEGIGYGRSIEAAKKSLWDAIAKAKAEHEGL